MRAALAFVGVIFGTLLLAAALAWPVWTVAHALGPDLPFHRVVSRLWQLTLLAGLLVALRRLRLRGREVWGYGLPRPQFLRQFGAGLAIGVATMLPMSVAMLALGILEPRAGAGALLLEGLATGAVTGLLVALVEETFFRGLMYRAVERESGFAAAAAATALVYAAIHFFARVKVPADEVTGTSGFRLLEGALAKFAQPLAIADAFATLVVVGLLLAAVRRRTGAIAACIGLHMGWISVIKATTAATDAEAASRWSFLVSASDGYTGWLVAAWAALLFGVAWSRGWLAPRPAVA